MTKGKQIYKNIKIKQLLIKLLLTKRLFTLVEPQIKRVKLEVKKEIVDDGKN